MIVDYIYKNIIFSLIMIIIGTIISYVIALYNIDESFKKQIWFVIHVILNDPWALGFFAGMVGTRFTFGVYDLYRSSKAASNFVTIVTNKILKEDLVSLLVVENTFKINVFSDSFVILSFRNHGYDYNISIIDHPEGIKIVTSEFMLKIMKPILETKGVQLETQK